MLNALPTIKNERWKYTSLRALDGFPGRTPAAPVMAIDDVPGLSVETSGRLVFLAGYYMPEWTQLPKGVSCVKTESSGVHLIIDAGTILSHPIDCVFLLTEQEKDCAVAVDMTISVAEHARADIMVRHVGAHTSRVFSRTHILMNVDPHAQVMLYHVQDQGSEVFHIENIRVNQKEHSHVSVHSLSIGALLARMDIDVHYEGMHARCDAYGIYHVNGKQHVDYHLDATHHQAHCQTGQHVKGCVDNEARAVFNGRVAVPCGAIKSVSEQSHHGILLSKRGRIDAKPELEIDCDDVQCRHGATVGALRQDALFYLMSRGIEAHQAKSMLELAHVMSLLEKISHQDIKSYMHALLWRKYGQ